MQHVFNSGRFFILLLMLIVILVLTQPVCAEQAQAQTQLQTHLAMLQNFQASFVQRVRAEDGTLLQEQLGTLTLAQPNRLHWQVQSPDETRLIADGQTVWYVDTFIEQVSIFNQSTLVQNNPMMLLASNDPQLWENFSVTRNSSGQFQVSALSTDAQIQVLLLTFIRDDLSAMTLQDNQGQVSEFSFTEQSQNRPLSVDIFSYAIPDSYSVDDQR